MLEEQDCLPDWENTTPIQLQEWGKKLGYAAHQYGEIRATLIVNCMEGRALYKLGITYDDKKTVLNNLVAILLDLLDRASVAEDDIIED
jgi:hypothetical protein